MKKKFLSIVAGLAVICLLLALWAVSGRAPVLILADEPGPEGKAWISLIFDDSEMGQMEAVEKALSGEGDIPRLYGGTIHSMARTRPFFALGAIVIRVDHKEIVGLESAVRRCLRERFPGNTIAVQLHPNESRARSKMVMGKRGNTVRIVE